MDNDSIENEAGRTPDKAVNSWAPLVITRDFEAERS